MMDISIIIQARLGSTRLPNKVVIDIEGKPMLWHHVNRLKHSKFSPEIIIATSKADEDKKILKFAEEYNFNSYAGNINDVLDRFYQTALKYKVNNVVRITADCPLIDPEVLDKILQVYLKGEYDYVSNIHPPTYPDGLDVEVFNFESLKRAWNEAQLASEREHVTPYIWKNPNLFRLKNVENDEDFSYLRWTVDEKEDLQLIREIYKNLYHKKGIFLMKDILELLKERPELKEINSKYIRNEGYLNSLREDKIVK